MMNFKYVTHLVTLLMSSLSVLTFIGMLGCRLQYCAWHAVLAVVYVCLSMPFLSITYLCLVALSMFASFKSIDVAVNEAVV